MKLSFTNRFLFHLVYGLLILSLFVSCSQPQLPTIAIIAKDTTNAIEKKNTLFVFVGEKIDVTAIPYEPGDFDSGVKAKYKVLQHVYGFYDKDVIEFEAYDHYGTPPFTKYKTVLLFVSEYKGKYYQEKYMYDPVMKTKDGRWAGPYSDDYGHAYNENTSIKPEKIAFVEEFSFPINIANAGSKEFEHRFPNQYYRIEGEKAIVVYGNYLPELFKLKRDGVLTARELFPGKADKENAIGNN